MLYRELLPHQHPQWAGDEDGRIGAAGKAHQKRKGEILGGIAAKEIQGKGGEQHREHGVKGTGKSLIDAAVGQLVQIAALPEMQPLILTDSVKDNDGIVDGITHDGQDCRHKAGIHLLLGK